MPADFNFFEAKQDTFQGGVAAEGARIKAGRKQHAADAFNDSFRQGVGQYERRREFDLESLQRDALMRLQEKRLGLDQQQESRLREESGYRMAAPDREQARADALGAALEGQTGQKVPTAGLAPTDVNAFMRQYNTQQRQQQKLAEAQQKQDEFNAQRDHAFEMFDTASSSAAKTLQPKEAAALKAMARKDPRAAMSKFMEISEKRSQAAQVDTFRKDVVGRTNKTANELETTGDHETARELRAAAAAMGNYHGRDAEQKLLELDQHAGQYSLKTPSEGSKKTEKGPEIVLQDGKKVPDQWGITKGGTAEELMSDPKRLAAFQSLAEEEAQADKAWPSAQAEAGIQSLPDDEMPAEEKAAALKGLEKLRGRITTKHFSSLAKRNGWEVPEMGPTGPMQKKAAGGKSAAATLREEEESGKFGTDAEFEARAKELGVKLK